MKNKCVTQQRTTTNLLQTLDMEQAYFYNYNNQFVKPSYSLNERCKGWINALNIYMIYTQ